MKNARLSLFFRVLCRPFCTFWDARLPLANAPKGEMEKEGGFAPKFFFCATLTKGERKNREICELIFSLYVCYNFKRKVVFEII